MLQINPLTVFLQFGYVEGKKTADGHSVGRCPFCGKQDHFFIKTESINKLWDCKHCSRNGGYKRFLECIAEVGISNFKGKAVDTLMNDRSIPAEVFRQMRVGFLPVSDQYIIPAYSYNGKDINNIKIYDRQSFKNTSGCKASMYGLWLLPKDTTGYERVYLTEGEWDTMVMTHIKEKNAIVIGAPGAGLFKTEVIPYLTGKEVYILFDNDLAGENGKKKIASVINSIASKIYCIDWPRGAKEGEDVRDLFKEHKAKTLEKIHSLCTPYLSEKESSEDVVREAKLPITPATEVYTVFKKWLHLPDTTVLDIIFGTVIANRFPGDPLWMFIVAPPGATKTEPLMALSGASRIETISSLTPHVLISGANFGGGGDPSLIPQLNNKVLIIKDFTSILGLSEMERDEIFSILRDAYDGECSKPFGNGIFRRYKSRFGILAAVTPAIEMFIEEHASLGERFLRWRNYLPNGYSERSVYVKRALGNVTKEIDLRAELNAIGKRVLLGEYTTIPTVSESMQERIIALAHLISMLRSTVHRDRYSKDIIHKSFIELGTRLAKQLYKLIYGITMFHQEKEVTEETYAVILSVARASVQARYYDAVIGMYKQDQEKRYTILDIMSFTGLPRQTCSLVMGNLDMLGIIRAHTDQGKAGWELTSEIIKLLKLCKLK